MSTPKDRFTATLSQLRSAEISKRSPGRMSLRVATSEGYRDVIVHGSRVTIGAHDENGVVLKEDAISSVHCELCTIADGETARLRDLGSKNGTWINTNVRVTDIFLPLGGSFTLGGATLTLVSINSVETPISTAGQFGQLHGCSSKMGELFALLDRLSTAPLDVLIVGETGTGKALAARSLHERSDRASGPFLTIDCANLNDSMAHEVVLGIGDQVDLLRDASGGTLFLYNIDDLSSESQSKMLHLVNQCQIHHGSDTSKRGFDVRIIAATHRDLAPRVGSGDFRDDLYFRLAQVTLIMPPLRDRGAVDISLLINLFLDRLTQERGREVRLERAARVLLSRYSWPGNVRQLRDVIRCASLLTDNDQIDANDLPPFEATLDLASQAGDDEERHIPFDQLEHAFRAPWPEARRLFEKTYIDCILEATGGNQSAAARHVGISRSAFRRLVSKVEGSTDTDSADR